MNNLPVADIVNGVPIYRDSWDEVWIVGESRFTDLQEAKRFAAYLKETV